MALYLLVNYLFGRYYFHAVIAIRYFVINLPLDIRLRARIYAQIFLQNRAAERIRGCAFPPFRDWLSSF